MMCGEWGACPVKPGKAGGSALNSDKSAHTSYNSKPLNLMSIYTENRSFA